MVSFTFTYHTDEFKVISEWALLSLRSPWLTEQLICDETVALFYISLTRGLVSGMIKSFTWPPCGAIVTCAAHKLEEALMKCHWDCSILKGYFAYYIAPPSTHLLFVNYAHDSESCHSSTALHNLQNDDFLIFSLSLHMDRCRRRTALSRFPAGAMSHSHPHAVTHTHSPLLLVWWCSDVETGAGFLWKVILDLCWLLCVFARANWQWVENCIMRG